MDVTEDYLSPNFCVPKLSDILTPQLVIDYSRINDHIIRTGQMTPYCDEVLRKMGDGNKFFLSLDYSSGYWQVPMSKKSRGGTALLLNVGSTSGMYFPRD